MKILILLFLLAAPSFAQSTCDKTAKEIPPIRGLSLGMPLEPAQLPVTARTRVEGNPDIGQRWLYLHASELKAERWTSIKSLNIELLDGSISEIWLTYDDSVTWATPEDVAKVFSESLNIPISLWTKATERMYQAKCNQLEIELIVGQDIWGKRYTSPSLRLFIPSLRATIEERARVNEERKRKTFRP